MKLEYFDIKLDNLPIKQFIKKYELLIPNQKTAYNKELPKNDEYIEDGETVEELIIEHLIPNTLEEEEEVKRHCEDVFDKTLTNVERSKIFEQQWNEGLITFEEPEFDDTKNRYLSFNFEIEEPEFHDTKEDYIHEYYY